MTQFLPPTATVLLTQEQLGVLLSLAMSSDPLPDGVDQPALNGCLDHLSQAFGATEWIDAYHRIPSR